MYLQKQYIYIVYQVINTHYNANILFSAVTKNKEKYLAAPHLSWLKKKNLRPLISLLKKQKVIKNVAQNTVLITSNKINLEDC